MKDVIFLGSVFGKNKQGYDGSTYGVGGGMPHTPYKLSNRK